VLRVLLVLGVMLALLLGTAIRRMPVRLA